MRFGNLWREIVLGIFFLDGIYASLQVSPLATAFGILDNSTATLDRAMGLQVLRTSTIYLYVSIGAEALGIVIGIVVAGILGLIAIALAYASGYMLLSYPLLGIALFVLSAILLFVGHRGKRKRAEERRKAAKGL
ncbi:MAG: hypothetical protein KGH69_01575 [Candidatus Micrarchaeota archaeon]|nr:hypothetical protein [Candidatus Micrarchaeota archaeon]